MLTNGSAWRVWTACLLATGIGASFGGIQVLLVLILRVYPTSLLGRGYGENGHR